MQSVFITAGASGLGLAMAEAFAKSGYTVAVSDSDTTALTGLATTHPDYLTIEADVASPPAMHAAYATLRQQWERLDVVIANAGIAGPTSPIESVEFAAWQECLAVNLNGAFLTTSMAALWMKEQGLKENQGGVMLLTSSTAGLFGYPYRAPYAAAKWAIIGLMKTLAMELGAFGIRANAICPGAVEGARMDRVIANEAKTRNLPESTIRQGYADCVSMRRFVTGEDIANMAVFLASNEARNISGVAMPVDGHTEKVTV